MTIAEARVVARSVDTGQEYNPDTAGAVLSERTTAPDDELLAKFEKLLKEHKRQMPWGRILNIIAISSFSVGLTTAVVGMFLIDKADSKLTAQKEDLAAQVADLQVTADAVQGSLEEIDIGSLNRLGPTGERLADSLGVLEEQLGFLDSNLCSQPAEGTPTMIEGWCPPEND